MDTWTHPVSPVSDWGWNRRPKLRVVAVDWLQGGGWWWTSKDMDWFVFDQSLCQEHQELYSWKRVVYQTSLLVLYTLVYILTSSSNKTTVDLYSIRGPSNHALPEPLNLTSVVHKSDSTNPPEPQDICCLLAHASIYFKDIYPVGLP